MYLTKCNKMNCIAPKMNKKIRFFFYDSFFLNFTLSQCGFEAVYTEIRIKLCIIIRLKRCRIKKKNKDLKLQISLLKIKV